MYNNDYSTWYNFGEEKLTRCFDSNGKMTTKMNSLLLPLRPGFNLIRVGNFVPGRSEQTEVEKIDFILQMTFVFERFFSKKIFCLRTDFCLRMTFASELKCLPIETLGKLFRQIPCKMIELGHVLDNSDDVKHEMKTKKKIGTYTLTHSVFCYQVT